ncbi:hypothetical protein D3C80_1940520 [compost metagenome]
MLGLECRLEPFKQDAADRQAAVVRVEPLDHVPGGVVAAGLAQHPFTEAYEAVIGFRLLPIQRADAPTVQRIVP